MGPLGHLHVESGVVDQDQRVGREAGHVVAAFAHLAADRAQVAQDLHDAEKRGFAVVLGQVRRAARGGHAVAAPEAEARFGIGGAQTPHEVGAVQVARGFAGDEVIVHVRVFSRLLS